MGEVAVLLRITPKPDEDLDTLQEKIEERIEVEDIEKKKIGFGLSIFKVLTKVEDKEGETDKLENLLSKIKGIKRAEVEDITLI